MNGAARGRAGAAGPSADVPPARGRRPVSRRESSARATGRLSSPVRKTPRAHDPSRVKSGPRRQPGRKLPTARHPGHQIPARHGAGDWRAIPLPAAGADRRPATSGRPSQASPASSRPQPRCPRSAPGVAAFQVPRLGRRNGQRAGDPFCRFLRISKISGRKGHNPPEPGIGGPAPRFYAGWARRNRPKCGTVNAIRPRSEL